MQFVVQSVSNENCGITTNPCSKSRIVKKVCTEIGKVWVVEISDLQDLMEFITEHNNRIIIDGENKDLCNGMNEIKIYDGWIE